MAQASDQGTIMTTVRIMSVARLSYLIKTLLWLKERKAVPRGTNALFVYLMPCNQIKPTAVDDSGLSGRNQVGTRRLDMCDAGLCRIRGP